MSWIAVTGFGPFVEVGRNPSGELAAALAAEPPPGVEVRHCVLPVSIRASAAELDRWLDGEPEPPRALLALGVHREGYFRLERRATARLHSWKRDNDGVLADGVHLPGEFELATTVDVERLARALRGAGAADVRVSDDAGGFVCERLYHHVLGRGRGAAFPAVFLHVPSLVLVSLSDQVPPARAVVAALAAG